MPELKKNCQQSLSVDHVQVIGNNFSAEKALIMQRMWVLPNYADPHCSILSDDLF